MNEVEGSHSARVTSELDLGGTTRELEGSSVGVEPALTDRNAWIDAAAAAGLAWLAVLCIGAFFLLAPKLQFPSLASGSDPVEIFTGIVIMSLGLMRVPVHIGGLTVTALPLGALTAIGVAIAWAVRSRGLKAASIRDAAWVGLRVGAAFALIGLVLAAVFRLRGAEPVAADAPWSLLLPFFWCVPFGALGALHRPGIWFASARAGISVRLRSSPGSALVPALTMIVGAALLGVAALLVWIIVAMANGPDQGFGWGDAGAAVIYLVAFLPNIVAALVALSVGAPVEQGAQVGMGGDLIGPLEQISLLDWRGATLAYGLLLVPVIACTAGGWVLARALRTRGDAWRPLLLAALTFAAAFAVIGWIGEARVGAGLVRERGFARVAVLPWPTFAWGILWAAVFGWLGFELGLRRTER